MSTNLTKREQIAALKRLEAWAAQDATGPVDAGGVSAWVRSQIAIALGREDSVTPVHLQPRSVSLMEIEIINLRNKIDGGRVFFVIEIADSSGDRCTPDCEKCCLIEDAKKRIRDCFGVHEKKRGVRISKHIEIVEILP